MALMIGKNNRIWCMFFILLFIGSLSLGLSNMKRQWNGTQSDQLEQEPLFKSDIINPGFPGTGDLKNFTYTGQNRTKTLLSFQGSGALNSNLDQDIVINTQKWNISNIQVNFDDIHIEEPPIIVEEATPPANYVTIFNSSVGIVNCYAMQFIVPDSCFLFKLRVYLRYSGNFSATAGILAADSGPVPKALNSGYEAVSDSKNFTTSGSQIRSEWVEFTFSPRILKAYLDRDKTSANSFFIVLSVNQVGIAGGPYFLQWGFQFDPVDNGRAYQQQGNNWVLVGGTKTIDLLLTNITSSQETWSDTFDLEKGSLDGNVVIYEEKAVGNTVVQDNAQQFQTNIMSYLTDLSVDLTYRGSFTVWAEIYNATKSNFANPNKPIPKSFLFKSDIQSISSALGTTNWVTFIFPGHTLDKSSFLNLRNTFNNTFFVVVKGTASGGILPSLKWGYVKDSSNGDQGLAYYWNSSCPPEYWRLFKNDPTIRENIDLTLKNINIISYEYNPSEVELQVNSTVVIDYWSYEFGGSVFLNGLFDGSRGTLLLDITASQPLYFQAVWNCIFNNQTHSITTFQGKSLATIINWNITLYTNFPQWNTSRDGAGQYSSREINITIPLDYTISRVKYKLVTLPQAGFWTTIPKNYYKILRIQNLTNLLRVSGYSGSWLISATSPNYMEEIITYNGTQRVTQFYVWDKLNVTARIKFQTSLALHLNIYNQTTNIVNSSLQVPGLDLWAKFPRWQITANGTHYPVVFWFNGTEVGIKSLSILCVYHTNLTVIHSNVIGSFQPSDTIYVDVKYLDLDHGVGIPRAILDVNISVGYWTYKEDLLHIGVYNITIYPRLLPNGNHTVRILARRAGYNQSVAFVKFQIVSTANATLKVAGQARFENGQWWVNPDPYFDDQTHFVTVLYANGTFPYRGIEYAQIIAQPDWTPTTWFGKPTNGTPGFYDVQIDTNGLHESDIGKIQITAYSPQFETKIMDIYVNITEIPISYLLMDAGEYQNITAYEGETIKIAVGFWDSFHGQPIIFENPSEGNLTWDIVDTGATGFLTKSVWQYESTISLPNWGILGTHTYDITITSTARRDYATYTTNLTLNVLSKENSSLILTNSTPTEYRIGHSFYIYANLRFENGTVMANKKVDFNISRWYESVLVTSFVESRFTNQLGVATYYYSEIPEGTDQIRINATYEGTEKIDPAAGYKLIPILPKYTTKLLLNNFTLNEYRTGQDLYLFATLSLENNTYLINYPILFNISFFEGFLYKGGRLDTKFTNASGIATYYLSPIPDHINTLLFEALFDETSRIQENSNSTTIVIGPKYNVSLEITSDLPAEVMVGSTLKLEARLLNNETQQGLANRTIEFTLIFDINNKITRTATTDSQGYAFIEIEIPSEMAAFDSFSILIKYEGSETTTAALYTADTQITIMTWMKLILGFLPYIAIALAIIIGSYLTYRQGVVAPRRRRRLARMEKIASKFADIVNLQHILVIHSQSGSCLFQHSFGEVTFDADLISGFLTAISAFQTEIKSPTAPKEKLPQIGEIQKEQGFELSYASFKILLKDGEKIRAALMLATSPTESVRTSLDKFVRLFEAKYDDALKDWRGAVTPFKTADTIVDLAFETSLLWPHMVETTAREEMKKLTSLENSLVTLALNIEQGYFFLPSLVNRAQIVRRESKVEILGTIDDLRRKKIFNAISIEELELKIQQQRASQNPPSSVS